VGDKFEEVRRSSDGELEGFVRRAGDGTFEARTVFHGLLGNARSRDEARAIVHARGLSSLAERWYWWSRATESWSVVLPQEVRAGVARVAVGYYALPGTPLRVITADDLDRGDLLTLEPPDAPVDGLP